MDLFTSYLKRCNYMLQQGNYVADVAYFIGEDAPKMTGVTSPALPRGYSFDYINAEVLMQRAKVVNGRMVLPGGMSYGLLVLPPIKTMRPALLKKINDLVAQGLHILGPAPEHSPSLENYPNADKEVKRLAIELWANPKVSSGSEIDKVLTRLNIHPDFEQPERDSLLFIHRKLPNVEIYFVSNQKEQTVKVSPSFNVSQLSPEAWDPVTGSIRKLPVFNEILGRTTVELELAPLQSLFVVFKKEEQQTVQAKVTANFPTPETIATIRGPWQVTFDPKLGGPNNAVKFDELIGWSKHHDEKIKYYAGTAVYQNTVKLSDVAKGETHYLTIDALNGMAKIKVNGIDVGGIWTAPWQVDITKAIKNGENKIEIAVVNNWMNRLIGDSKLPVEARTTKTVVNPYKPSSTLQTSGLIGVVKIEKVKY